MFNSLDSSDEDDDNVDNENFAYKLYLLAKDTDSLVFRLKGMTDKSLSTGTANSTTSNHRRSIASPIFTELPLPQECSVDRNQIDFNDESTTAEHSPFSESCYTLNSASESSLLNEGNNQMSGKHLNNQGPPSLINILEKIGQPSDLSTNNVVIHLRSTIANLLVDNDKLNETIDNLNSKCIQLENEKILHKENITPETARLQTELNETRLREADLQMALEELKSRIDLTDKIVQSEPQLLEFFNSIIHDKIPPKSRSVSISTTNPCSTSDNLDLNRIQNQQHPHKNASFNRLDTIVDNSPMIQPNGGSHVNPIENELLKETTKKHQGFESPQSDSGLSSSYSASGPSSTAEWTSSQISTKKPKVDSNKVFETTDDSDCYVLRRQKESNINYDSNVRSIKSNSMYEPNIDSYFGVMNDSPFVKSIDFEVTDLEIAHDPREKLETKPPPVNNAISKWRNSLKESFSWISKDSGGVSHFTGPVLGRNIDYKFEALAAKHGEARALAKLRTTQVELKRVKAKCQQFESHFAKQDETVHKLEQQLDEQKSRERKLKHEIRLLQRKIFQMEANHREFEVTQKIKEMELSSKLAEITFRITQSDTINQQISAWNQIKSSSIGDTPTPVSNYRPSVPYSKVEESLLAVEIDRSNLIGNHSTRAPPNTLEISKQPKTGNHLEASPMESLNQYKLDQDLIESIMNK